MAEKKTYKNKNGNLSIEAFVRLVHTGQIDQFMRKHTVSDDPCPPTNLIDSDVRCFWCVDCQRHCISQVKEYKDYYLVKKVKYPKKDLETND